MERLVVLSDSETLKLSDLPEYCFASGAASPANRGEKKTAQLKSLKEARKEFETEYIKNALLHCGGNISETARKLDLSRRQLTNKINDYDI